AGHALVELLAELGEDGARELIRLRERTRYHYPGRAIQLALQRLARQLVTPLGEFEDAFAGPVLDADLSLALDVGPYEAVIRVSEDFRRVHTTWRRSGGVLRSRPARARDYPAALELVVAERRRLQVHLTDQRSRLELAMATGRRWTLEQ